MTRTGREAITVDTVAVGDRGVAVRIGGVGTVEAHARILAILQAVDDAKPPWLIDAVPGHTSLLVIYEPLAASFEQVRTWLAGRCAASGQAVRPSRQMTIPVLYRAAVGIDLEDVAAHLGVTVDEVVSRHSNRAYIVTVLGFKPGFPYMLEVDERLRLPRLDSPRSRVAAGSVAIAGRQTGVYPVDCPGGWRILGRTPLRLFDPRRAEPALLRPGDTVRFEPIDERRFDRLAEEE
jgi:KipI family sensor histidine kinase inhibitor